MSEPLHPKLIFSVSTITIAVAGLGILALNTFGKVDTELQNYNLTKGLWKFDLVDRDKINLKQQRIAWYKLLCAGLMIAALSVSTTVRFMPPLLSVSLGIGLWILWAIFLLIYWYFVTRVVSRDTSSIGNENTTSKNSNNDNNDEDDDDHGWKKKSINIENKEDRRLPVTIITGFLGSGKTTLVKNILHNTIGMKVLVIENEIGNEGIDHELLMQHTNVKEDVILMNNGCICCTVRNDLLSTFRKMFSNSAFSLLDWIVIETTGLADPAPVIQSFYMDRECSQRMRIDSVITVVDAKHIPLHLAEYRYEEVRKGFDGGGGGRGSQQDNGAKKAGVSGGGVHGGIPEAILQISFADRILLNKVDLLAPSSSSSSSANGSKANEKKAIDKIKASIHEINCTAIVIPCSYANVDITEVLNVKAFDPKRATISSLLAQENAAIDRPILIQRDAQGKILKQRVTFNANSRSNGGRETTGKSLAANGVSTISLVTDEEIDLFLFNQWITEALEKKGADIYRMKGILAMKGFEEQFVCHGIHMIFDGEKGPKWKTEKQRRSRLVIIGKQLRSEDWEEGFRKTFAVINL